MLSINSTSEIEDNHKFDEILTNTNFNVFDITYSPMNDQHNESVELSGTASAPADDATGMMGMAPRDGRCGNMHVGLDSCHFAMPWHCSRPSVYSTRSPVYPQRLIETGIYSKLSCIQKNVLLSVPTTFHFALTPPVSKHLITY